jgi:hypothetical protein
MTLESSKLQMEPVNILESRKILIPKPDKPEKIYPQRARSPQRKPLKISVISVVSVVEKSLHRKQGLNF